VSTYAHLSIGFGGWTMHSADGNVRLSHYGSTWREHRSTMLPGIVGVDLTPCEDPGYPGCRVPSAELVELSIRGPMVNPAVPVGTIRGFGSERPFDPSLPNGGARSLDYVSPTDYAPLAAAIGARVFDPLTED
jgi:hypothetical protein